MQVFVSKCFVLLSAAAPLAVLAQPTLYTFGDSTMAHCRYGYLAKNSGGWGTYLSSYLDIPVVNYGKSGYSARQAAREDIYKEALDKVQPDDYVILQWGRNDGRAGDDKEACQDPNGCKGPSPSEPVIHSFDYYMIEAAKRFQAKGVKVIIASLATQNLWRRGRFETEANSFIEGAKKAAEATDSTFVDLHQALTDLYRKLTPEQVGQFYVGNIAGHNDQSHLTPLGALIVARRFLIALIKGTQSDLKQYVLHNSKSISLPYCPA